MAQFKVQCSRFNVQGSMLKVTG